MSVTRLRVPASLRGPTCQDQHRYDINMGYLDEKGRRDDRLIDTKRSRWTEFAI